MEQTVYACSGSQLVLNCSSSDDRSNSAHLNNDKIGNSIKATSSVIKITRANYGRFSIALCNEEGRTDWSVNCYSPKTKRVISDRYATVKQTL